MNPPRHTARQVADDVAAGMDPDVELVAAQYYDALRAELARVKAESLRVVVDGEAISVDFLPVGIRISVPDRTGVYRRVGSGASAKPEPHSFVILEDCNSGEEINVPYGTQGYVVRLELWEDE